VLAKERFRIDHFLDPFAGGGPVRRMMLSDATRGLRILLHVAPRAASVLQTNFSEYQRRPRFQVT